ncbi:MAG: ATP-binding cassette domain-containing protein [Ruminococcaceae bacterium]|nr:ATP-binding cassette domain-containing protein [Oscillospiraceae bacterium]
MIEIDKLNKTYSKHTKFENKVLHDISLSLPDKGFICVLGPSGCGKTSLLNAVGGLDYFDSGRVTFEKINLGKTDSKTYNTERNKNFGYIFQNYYLLPEHSVGYNIYLGLHSLKISHKEKLNRVFEALKAVDMEKYVKRKVNSLSGGQQQRVAIARAIARRPRVIFADEPTGNLDEQNTVNICSILRKISKTSLVVMVTHEERIAKFFADRIIRISGGRIISDTETLTHDNLDISSEKTVYKEDFSNDIFESNSLKLNILSDASPSKNELTLIILKDKILIKAPEGINIDVSKENEVPLLKEGKRPSVTLESIDNDGELIFTQNENDKNIKTKAGAGIKFKDMLKEAFYMNKETSLRSVATRIFLIILSVLTVITAGDFITLSKVDPEDFIISDSHILNVSVEKGPELSTTVISLDNEIDEIIEGLKNSGIEHEFLPIINRDSTLQSQIYMQLGDLKTRLNNFSYIPLNYLEESDLIYGRMPENAEEIVIDRWVLDKFMEKEGITQNGIKSIDQFLGKSIIYNKRVLEAEIVGICDSGEPSVYIDREMYISICVRGCEVASISKFKDYFKGEFDELTLEDGECLVICENAGMAYKNRIGSTYGTSGFLSFTIAGAPDVSGFYPSIVVSDNTVSTIQEFLIGTVFNIYTEDKEAVTEHLNSIPLVTSGQIKISVNDVYTEKMANYLEATKIKTDARLIVTVSVILLSLIMLYLLRRSEVQKEIVMLAVYRLLGIPKRKLCLIFILESIINTFITVLPTVLASYGIVFILNNLPSLQFSFLLPIEASLLVYLAVALFHLIVTLIPLISLLSLPPAILANKYDF